MATGSLTLTQDHQNVEYHLVTLFEKLDAVRRDATCVSVATSSSPRPSMQAEVRTLEFWRSIISECLATFFYVFIVCGAAAGAASASGPGVKTSTSTVLSTALATGFIVATLTQCFGHISGAHLNPAVTVAMAATRNISPLRAAMYMTAQCGGGIAGAALLYGVAEPGYQGNLSATVVQIPAHLTAWERFGVEFILTFIVVFTYFVSMDTYRKWLGSSALSIGSAYLACSLVSIPSLNPARSLGPAFVMNKWDNHWVYWFGPMLGGMVSGLIYEFIFNPRRHTRQPKESIDGDSSSIHSDEDPYDELDKPVAPKFHGSTYNTLRGGDVYRAAGSQAAANPASPTGAGNTYCPSLTSASLYSAPPCKLDRVESLYGGTKSLYAKSPPLTRANLNRSQSVYSKVPSGPAATQRDGIPRPGPLVPAQSLYPMRFNQNNTTTANQNVQNQQNLRSENIYGVRGVIRTQPEPVNGLYGVGHGNPGPPAKFGGCQTRPESMYGLVVNRRQDSADSSYGSYHSGGAASNANSSRGGSNGNYTNTSGNSSGGNGNYSGASSKSSSGPTQGFNAVRTEIRQQPHQLLTTAPTSIINTTNTVASYHHNQRHSPNPQY